MASESLASGDFSPSRPKTKQAQQREGRGERLRPRMPRALPSNLSFFTQCPAKEDILHKSRVVNGDAVYVAERFLALPW